MSIHASTSGTLLVQRQSPTATTIFRRVTSACHLAVADHTWNRGVGRRYTVIAVTFVGVLHPSNGEPLAHAKVDTRFNRHSRATSACTFQSPIVVIIRATTGIRPFFGCGQISVVSRASPDGGVDGTISYRSCHSWARCDRIASWECWKDARSHLVDLWSNLAAFSLRIRGQIKDGTIFNISAIISALIDGAL